MRRSLVWRLMTFQVTALALLALVGFGQAIAHAKAEPAPPLDLSVYRGKVVYLDFWASWCVPCRKSFPWMNTMQRKYGDQGFVVIGVNLDKQQEQAARFLGKVPAEFTIVYDPAGTFAQQYKLEGMPSSFLIDRQGRIQARHIGYVPAETADYEAKIAALLK